jgi:hypothetical protein
MFEIKTTYDEQFARQAPGVLLHFETMKACHETSDAAWIDTCSSPEFENLLRLYPDRRRITSYFLPLGRNPVDRLAVRLFMALQPLHQQLIDVVVPKLRSSIKVNLRGWTDEPLTTPPQVGSGDAGAPDPVREPTEPTLSKASPLETGASKAVGPRTDLLSLPG